MFGLSLTKILFTVLVIVAVWRAFTLVSRLQAHRQVPGGGGPPRADTGGADRAPSRRRRDAATRPQQRVVDLVECRSCGSYLPRGEVCRCRRG